MSRLSILIPFVGNTKLLEDTLVSVLENRPRHCEVLVVLGRRYEDPYDLGDEVRFLQTPKQTDLVGCLNLGVRMSRAGLIHVLACGAEVAEGWTEAAMGHFEDPRVACVVPLVLDARRPQRIIAAGVDYRPGGNVRLLHHRSVATTVPSNPAPVLGPHPAAAFYRKSTLEQMGGFDAEVGGRLAMLDLALLLQRTGRRTILEPRCPVRLAAYDSVGAFRRAMEAERFFWRWASSNGWSRSLALHTVALAAEAARELWRPGILSWIVGRFVGGLSVRQPRRCRLRLEKAASSNSAAGSVKGPHYAVPGANPANDAQSAPPQRSRRSIGGNASP